MAFDLVVGENGRAKNSPVVGSIGYDELPIISRLLRRMDSFFLRQISDLFTDRVFSVEEIGQALQQLLPLLAHECEADERTLLYKLIAVLAYAKAKGEYLYGIAD